MKYAIENTADLCQGPLSRRETLNICELSALVHSGWPMLPEYFRAMLSEERQTFDFTDTSTWLSTAVQVILLPILPVRQQNLAIELDCGIYFLYVTNISPSYITETHFYGMRRRS